MVHSPSVNAFKESLDRFRQSMMNFFMDQSAKSSATGTGDNWLSSEATQCIVPNKQESLANAKVAYVRDSSESMKACSEEIGYGSLVRKGTGPKGHKSEGAVVRRFYGNNLREVRVTSNLLQLAVLRTTTLFYLYAYIILMYCYLLFLFIFITFNVIAFKKAMLSRGNRVCHAAINFDAGMQLLIAFLFCRSARFFLSCFIPNKCNG